MTDSGRQRFLSTVMLLGVVYAVVGVVSAALAGAAGSPRTQFIWRLSAFAVSGVVFAAHVAFEHFRLRNRGRTVAWHTSAAVAAGGFALAVAANIHDLGTTSGYRPRMLIALVAWPLLTAVPAFIVALALAALLGMKRPQA